MSDQPVTAMLDVFRVDADTGARDKVGEVEYHADGRLGIVEVDPAFDALLRRAVASVNAKEKIVELIPPENAERSVGSKATARDDAAFQPALSRYLERYYGFSIDG